MIILLCFYYLLLCQENNSDYQYHKSLSNVDLHIFLNIFLHFIWRPFLSAISFLCYFIFIRWIEIKKKLVPGLVNAHLRRCINSTCSQNRSRGPFCCECYRRSPCYTSSSKYSVIYIFFNTSLPVTTYYCVFKTSSFQKMSKNV